MRIQLNLRFFNFIFAASFSMILIFIYPAAKAAESAPVEYIYWRMSEQTVTPDNGVMTTYELACSRDDIDIAGAELIFISAARGGADTGSAEIYTKKLFHGADGIYRVDIYSGRNERITLLAKAQTGGRQFYARTLLNGYGQSGRPDPDAVRVDKIPDWPEIRMAAEEYFYRPQTGTPLDVRIENGPKAIYIFENNGFVGKRMPNDGFYSYTPPHDEALSRAGYSAKNDLVFVAGLRDGKSSASLYLPIYRAYYGQISLKGGLMVLSASVMICFFLILHYGRKWRWN